MKGGVLINKTDCGIIGDFAKKIANTWSQDRIEGAMRIGNYWAIPSEAEKPTDQRIKSGRYNKSADRENSNKATKSQS